MLRGNRAAHSHEKICEERRSVNFACNCLSQQLFTLLVGESGWRRPAVAMPALNAARVRPAAAAKPTSGALTSGQKAVILLGAVLVGPAVLKKFYVR